MGYQDTTRRLLEAAGETYAEEAGIRLDDKPMPLFELLVLCMLASKPIDATTATRAAHELFAEKLRTPATVLEADRATMIEAFGRAGYARYDELGHSSGRHCDRGSGRLRRRSAESGFAVRPRRRAGHKASQGVQGHR